MTAVGAKIEGFGKNFKKCKKSEEFSDLVTICVYHGDDGYLCNLIGVIVEWQCETAMLTAEKSDERATGIQRL